jgi:hypothetical protein
MSLPARVINQTLFHDGLPFIRPLVRLGTVRR